MTRVRVNVSKCDGCAECLGACPFLAIEIREGLAVIAESCLECGLCVPACPHAAIEAPEALLAGSRSGGVWVFLPEGDDGLGALTPARDIADELGRTVSAVMTREPDDPAPIFSAGADEIAVLGGSGALARRLAAAVRSERPAAVLAMASPVTDRVMARVATILGAPYVQGADDVEVPFGETVIYGTRPLFGGRFRCTLVPDPSRPLVATLNPVAFSRVRADGGKRGKIRNIEVDDFTDEGLKYIERVRSAVPLRLEDARVVLAGGPALGEEGFLRLRQLADRLGAAVGASKEAVEAGLADEAEMVDGREVSPDVYMAFGIDGSPAHNAAVAGSKVVVAVTENERANILGSADYIILLPPLRAVEGLLEALRAPGET